MSDETEALLAERACERLVIDSATHNDLGDWAALCALYTPEARLVRPSGQVVDGRAAIEESYRQAPADRRTRHVCANLRVVLDGEDAASASTLVLLYSWTESTTGSAEGLPIVGPPALGEFVDTFARGGEGWRISSRTARLLARPHAP